MPDRIIGAEDARIVDDIARQQNPLTGWVIRSDEADYPGKVVARLIDGSQPPNTLIGDTIDDVREQLPPNLECCELDHPMPSEVREVWFPISRYRR